MPTPPPDSTSGQTTAASNVSNTQPLPPQATSTQTPQVSAQTGQTQQPQPSGDTAQSSQPQAQQPQAQQSMVSNDNRSGSAMVSNTPPSTLGAPAPPNSTVPPDTPNAGHPAVQKAGVTNSVALALAGGPRYKTTIDPNTGDTTRTPIPVSRKDVALAIAFEAISGALSGLGVAPGPGVVGRAAAAGFQQGQKGVQDRQQADEQQAQNDVKAQTSALGAQAAAFAANAKTVLNTAQSERYGVESLKDAVNANASLLAGYQDADVVQDSHVSADALTAGLKSGAYSATSQLAIPDGITNLNGRYEQTFSVVADPRAKVPITDAQAQAFGDAGIPGWLQYKGGKSKLPDGYQVPGTFLASANAQLQAINLMKQDVNGVVDTLAKSGDTGNRDAAASIPNFGALLSDPDNGPPLQRALTKFQKYVSHSDWHGMDVFESLRQMAAPSKADPQNPKQFIPNPDAPAAQVIAGAFGNGDPQKGWAILQRYHDEVTPEPIKSVAQAQSILSDTTSGPKEVTAANKFLALDRQQKSQTAGAEERARQAAKPSTVTPGSLTQPDALGFTPTITDPKEANKRFNSFKKSADDLAKTEQTYAAFTDTLNDINAGKDLSGAASVVALFNAIGLSGTALKGQGFRVNENVIREHEQARGWLGAVQQRALNVKAGDVITPQQIRDYADIAANARRNQYVAIANEAHNAGISANPFLPTGNGQKIDPSTARIFFQLSGNDPNKARAAATAKGWSVQ